MVTQLTWQFRWPNVFVFLGSVVLAALFFLQFCDLLFDCGCRALWAGGAAACNVHDAGSRDCPWCAHGVLGALPFAGVVVGQAIVAFSGRTRGLAFRAMLAVLAFPLLGGLAALAFGLADSYWS